MIKEQGYEIRNQEGVFSVPAVCQTQNSKINQNIHRGYAKQLVY